MQSTTSLSSNDTVHVFFSVYTKLSLDNLKKLNKETMQALLERKDTPFDAYFKTLKELQIREDVNTRRFDEDNICFLEAEISKNNVKKFSRQSNQYYITQPLKPENIIKIYPKYQDFLTDIGLNILSDSEKLSNEEKEKKVKLDHLRDLSQKGIPNLSYSKSHSKPSFTQFGLTQSDIHLEQLVNPTREILKRLIEGHRPEVGNSREEIENNTQFWAMGNIAWRRSIIEFIGSSKVIQPENIYKIYPEYEYFHDVCSNSNFVGTSDADFDKLSKNGILNPLFNFPIEDSKNTKREYYLPVFIPKKDAQDGKLEIDKKYLENIHRTHLTNMINSAFEQNIYDPLLYQGEGYQVGRVSNEARRIVSYDKNWKENYLGYLIVKVEVEPTNLSFIRKSNCGFYFYALKPSTIFKPENIVDVEVGHLPSDLTVHFSGTTPNEEMTTKINEIIRPNHEFKEKNLVSREMREIFLPLYLPKGNPGPHRMEIKPESLFAPDSLFTEVANIVNEALKHSSFQVGMRGSEADDVVNQHSYYKYTKGYVLAKIMVPKDQLDFYAEKNVTPSYVLSSGFKKFHVIKKHTVFNPKDILSIEKGNIHSSDINDSIPDIIENPSLFPSKKEENKNENENREKESINRSPNGFIPKFYRVPHLFIPEKNDVCITTHPENEAKESKKFNP